MYLQTTGRDDFVQASGSTNQISCVFGGMDPPVSVAEAGWYGGMPLLGSFMMDGMGWNAVACMYAD
jgi:hypothetical protein